MYDSFEPFKNLSPFDFRFFPNKFEIWKNGNLIKEGVYEHQITCNVLNSKMFVELDGIIKQQNIFDKISTSIDRIIMYTIPKGCDNNNVNILNHFFEVTRPHYNFESNEAYACSIFFRNGSIVKLAFNLYNDQLVEFY